MLRVPDAHLVLYLPPTDLGPLAAATCEQLRHDGSPIAIARDIAGLLP